MKLSLISASSLFLIASAAVVAPLSAGCTANEATGDSGEDLSQGTTFDVKMPAGSSYNATITTNGSAACPRGDTLSAALAADGSSLKLVFVSYAASVTKNQSSKSVDCALQIVLKSRSTEQVAVSSVAFTGYSSLDKSGMLETHGASYGFAGGADATEELDVKGPATGTYSFKDAIADARKTWSACGTSSTLNTSLKTSLANNAAKTGTGLLDPASHGVHHTLTIGLAHQACAPVVDAGAVDPGDSGTDPGRDGGGTDPDPRDAGTIVLPDFDGGVIPPIDFDAGGLIPTPRGGR
jgi:hypothetical protein